MKTKRSIGDIIRVTIHNRWESHINIPVTIIKIYPDGHLWAGHLRVQLPERIGMETTKFIHEPTLTAGAGALRIQKDPLIFQY